MSATFDIPDLECDLRDLLAQIPAGKVATCGMLAQALGSATAAKWIGHFALHHRHDEACNCHRIVRARGELGGYVAGKPNAKIARLEREGVAVEGETVDLARYGFDNFASGYPLGKLRELQERLARQVSIRPRKRMPKLIGGVDVAYPAAEEASAAYALVEADSGRLVWSHVVRRSVRFPYISGFLSFRELPILLELIAEVRAAGKMAAAILVDGSGILHPRRAGAAAHLGVAAATATIGVTKKLLCGQVDLENVKPLESRPVWLDERLVGAAIRPTSGSRRPIFISPGHRVDLPFAERIVRQFLLGHRLPEPLYWADRLSKKAEGKGTAEGGEQMKNSLFREEPQT